MVIETAEQRRARFLRLAAEAASIAAKIPVPSLRLRYLELSETLKSEAEHVLEEVPIVIHPHEQTLLAVKS